MLHLLGNIYTNYLEVLCLFFIYFIESTMYLCQYDSRIFITLWVIIQYYLIFFFLLKLFQLWLLRTFEAGPYVLLTAFLFFFLKYFFVTLQITRCSGLILHTFFYVCVYFLFNLKETLNEKIQKCSFHPN